MCYKLVGMLCRSLSKDRPEIQHETRILQSRCETSVPFKISLKIILFLFWYIFFAMSLEKNAEKILTSSSIAFRLELKEEEKTPPNNNDKKKKVESI